MIQRTTRTSVAEDLRPAMSLGAEVRTDGVEFRVFSRNATEVTLLLFPVENPHGPPSAEIPMHRTGDVWHAVVPHIGAGQPYAYRVDGPNVPERGHHFDSRCYLLDPYAKALTTNGADGIRDRSLVAAAGTERARSVVVEDAPAWQPVTRPGFHQADSIIYEVHLRGMTAHPSARVPHAGTYRGFQSRVDYLRDLGVTAVEFLPIHEFDRLENPRSNPETDEKLTNYWGYSTVGFFAPNGRYAAGTEPGAPVEEFRDLVRELHDNGLEVILDVVYNHTAEGHHMGPVLSFKGFDNSIYYHLADDRRFYKDFSGCGNSVNCNHPVARQLIMDSLRYWVTRFGVDGFRFDLASVLSRDRHGVLVGHAPLLEEISEDPFLRDTKIIAEAWDAAGAFQVGSFPGGRFAEWNGKYRDEVRQYWRGDAGRTGALATRLMGSSDLYQGSGRRPWHSINFVTCHDGFTLADLVSYNGKHNHANGEENRDGESHNYSFNYGVEGPTDDPRVESLRLRHMRNLLGTLLVSQGVPMILGGDEFRRTQHGNNNAYCQDNALSWFDWTLLETNADLHRFVRELIWFRRRHPVLRRRSYFSGKRRPNRKLADVNWYEPDGRPKEWHRDDHTLVCLLDGLPPEGGDEPADNEMLILFNAGFSARYFTLVQGEAPNTPWQLIFDTGVAPPRDIYPEGRGPKIDPGSNYPMVERSMALFTRGHV